MWSLATSDPKRTTMPCICRVTSPGVGGVVSVSVIRLSKAENLQRRVPWTGRGPSIAPGAGARLDQAVQPSPGCCALAHGAGVVRHHELARLDGLKFVLHPLEDIGLDGL